MTDGAPLGRGERVLFSADPAAGRPGRIVLRSAPDDTGRCRRPVPGRVYGHLVVRPAAVGCATELVDPHVVTAGDVDDVTPWAVGDLVDVHPLREPASRCGRCVPCRAAAAVSWCRRAARAVRERNVTIAVVTLMVGPTLVFLAARFLL